MGRIIAQNLSCIINFRTSGKNSHHSSSYESASLTFPLQKELTCFAIKRKTSQLKGRLFSKCLLNGKAYP